MTPDISKAPHLVKRTHVASDSTCARKPPWLAASCMPPPPTPPGPFDRTRVVSGLHLVKRIFLATHYRGIGHDLMHCRITAPPP